MSHNSVLFSLSVFSYTLPLNLSLWRAPSGHVTHSDVSCTCCSLPSCRVIDNVKYWNHSTEGVKQGCVHNQVEGVWVLMSNLLDKLAINSNPQLPVSSYSATRP